MNIPEFRKTLKACFDQADQGKTITITRLGKVYKLRKVAE